MKHKIGDRVRVRKNLVLGLSYGDYAFTGGMLEYAGRECVITVIGGDYYRVNIDGEKWYWAEDMLEAPWTPSGVISSEKRMEMAILLMQTLMSMDYMTFKDNYGKSMDPPGVVEVALEHVDELVRKVEEGR